MILNALSFEPGNNIYYYLILDTSAGRELLADWDHFHVLFEQILHRMPSLANASFNSLVNIAETFSPDCKWIVGQAPEVCCLILLLTKTPLK